MLETLVGKIIFAIVTLVSRVKHQDVQGLTLAAVFTIETHGVCIVINSRTPMG